MKKTVSQVLSTVRLLLRMPDEQTLPSEHLRAVLHMKMEEYHRVALQQNKDFYTQSDLITFSYSKSTRRYTPVLTTITNLDYYPAELEFQPLTSDPDTGVWRTATLVKANQFPSESGKAGVVACFTGNRWADPNGVVVRLSLLPEKVKELRWNLTYRVFPTEILEFADVVPFPQEFTELLSYAVAVQAATIIDKPSWSASFMATGYPALVAQQRKLEAEFVDWLTRDVENVYVTEKPFNYRRLNTNHSVAEYRVEPVR